MKIKDRVDDFRGLKALWSAPIIMVGLTIQHNFIEEHPYEKEDILKNIEISVHARYGENNTAKKVMEIL